LRSYHGFSLRRTIGRAIAKGSAAAEALERDIPYKHIGDDLNPSPYAGDI
jgi:hypothetical protein